MHFAVWTTNGAGTEPARLEHRDAFEAYLRNHPDHPGVTVRHAGPTLAEDGQSIIGALFVIEAPTLEAARALMADSPYGKAGIFADWHVRPWTWMTGGPA